MLSPRSEDSWLLWVVVMLWCCVCGGGDTAARYWQPLPQQNFAHPRSNIYNRYTHMDLAIHYLNICNLHTYVLHVLCTYLSRYIKLLSFPAPLTFSMQEIMCDEKHILWTRPRPPKSILHISTWPRREDLWLKVFEGNLLKMFPFQVQTCLQLQRVDLIKRKVIIRSVQWQYRWRLSYIMEVIVTSAVQYSTVQYSGLAQSADARPASVSSCTLYLPTAALVSREHSTAQYSTVQHSTVLILYSSASAPRPASQPPSWSWCTAQQQCHTHHSLFLPRKI